MYLIPNNTLFILARGIHYDDPLFFSLIKNVRVWDCDNENFSELHELQCGEESIEQ